MNLGKMSSDYSNWIEQDQHFLDQPCNYHQRNSLHHGVSQMRLQVTRSLLSVPSVMGQPSYSRPAPGELIIFLLQGKTSLQPKYICTSFPFLTTLTRISSVWCKLMLGTCKTLKKVSLPHYWLHKGSETHPGCYSPTQWVLHSLSVGEKEMKQPNTFLLKLRNLQSRRHIILQN